jgi:hypothetical protein
VVDKKNKNLVKKYKVWGEQYVVIESKEVALER